DLKPANVIVLQGSSPPSPKVIDFGISRAAGDGPGTTPAAYGGWVGTLEYASPEQLRHDPRLDVRSDLYSAGIILYELLTGTRPFRLSQSTVAEFVDRVRTTPSTAPSRYLEASGRLDVRAASMGTSPAKLLRMLSDDLDWIVLEAIEKIPSDRYDSAGA